MKPRLRSRLLAAAAILAMVLAATLILATGCNVVAWQRGRIASQLTGAGLTERTIAVCDATMHVWEGGKGPAVLLVHGFGPEALWQWHDQADALVAKHRVIIPDLLWFGESSSPNHDFSLAHQARCLSSLLDALGERAVDVVGMSYGGLVTAEMLTLFPEHVNRVVIVDSPACAYQRADYDEMLKRYGATKAYDFLVATDEASVDRLMGLAYEKPPWTPGFAKRQAVKELYGRWHEEQAALLESPLQALATRPGCEAVPAKKTLIIWGRNDPVFPLAIGERLQSKLGVNATLRIIEKARHAPNLEHVDEFNALLGQFLDPAPE